MNCYNLLVFNEEFRIAVDLQLSLQVLSDNEQSRSLVLPKKSWIAEANIGLFAQKHIQKGQVIGKYFGKGMKTKDAIKMKDKSYLMRLGQDVINNSAFINFHTYISLLYFFAAIH